MVTKVFLDNTDDELKRIKRGLRTYERGTSDHEKDNFDDDINEKIARLEETLHERELQLGIYEQQQNIQDARMIPERVVCICVCKELNIKITHYYIKKIAK